MTRSDQTRCLSQTRGPGTWFEVGPRAAWTYTGPCYRVIVAKASAVCVEVPGAYYVEGRSECAALPAVARRVRIVPRSSSRRSANSTLVPPSAAAPFGTTDAERRQIADGIATVEPLLRHAWPSLMVTARPSGRRREATYRVAKGSDEARIGTAHAVRREDLSGQRLLALRARLRRKAPPALRRQPASILRRHETAPRLPASQQRRAGCVGMGLIGVNM